jgi:molybdate transport system substrate-binding protein
MVAIARRAVLLVILLMGLASALGAEQPLTVFAAASLKTALDQANQAFAAETGIPVRASYAASSALAKQIAQGAPADAYASADVDWMDDLDSRKLILAGTRVDLLGNRLVVIAAKDGAVSALALDPSSFTSALGGRRLALAEITSVPAGRYAKAALQSLGLWEELRRHLAMAENVRAALRFVSRGEAPHECDPRPIRAVAAARRWLTANRRRPERRGLILLQIVRFALVMAKCHCWDLGQLCQARHAGVGLWRKPR